MTSLAPDTVTILRSRSGVLTKRIAADRRVIGFSAGAWFSVYQREVPTFNALAALLPQVASDPYACIIRGALLPGVDDARCRRLCDRALHGDAVTFDRLPAPVARARHRRRARARLPDLRRRARGRRRARPGAAAASRSPTRPAGGRPPASAGHQARHPLPAVVLAEPPGRATARPRAGSAGHPVDRSLFTPGGAALHRHRRSWRPACADPSIRRCGVRHGLDDTVERAGRAAGGRGQARRPRWRSTALSRPPTRPRGAGRGRAPLAAPSRAIWTGERAYPDRSTRALRPRRGAGPRRLPRSPTRCIALSPATSGTGATDKILRARLCRPHHRPRRSPRRHADERRRATSWTMPWRGGESTRASVSTTDDDALAEAHPRARGAAAARLRAAPPDRGQRARHAASPQLDAAVRAARQAAGDEQARTSQRDALVGIALTPASCGAMTADDGFATIQVGGHREHHRVRSAPIRRWLVREYGDRSHSSRGRAARLPARPARRR